MAGDNIGVLLRGVERDEIDGGQVLAAEALPPYQAPSGSHLSKEEGGRHTPFFSGYRPSSTSDN